MYKGSGTKNLKIAYHITTLGRRISRDRILLLMILPVMGFLILFRYVPMYGVLIAFKRFSPLQGIIGSPWIGFRWFEQAFRSDYFWRAVRNTFLLNVYSLVFSFPIPVIFALLLNELRNKYFKKFVQTVSYLPHFISVVIVVGMLTLILSRNGIVNTVMQNLGFQPVDFMMQPQWFRTIYITSEIWQGFGWNSIIYLAALTAIDLELYEACVIDGGGRWKQMYHITIPGILPTIIILLIIRIGNIMSSGFEKILIMYNPLTYETADVLATYTYRAGILGSQYSFATAIGLFDSVINLVLLITINKVSRKITEVSLW